jgi:hypothetical protein
MCCVRLAIELFIHSGPVSNAAASTFVTDFYFCCFRKLLDVEIKISGTKMNGWSFVMDMEMDDCSYGVVL